MSARPCPCELPPKSHLRSSLLRVDYLDSFAVTLNRPADDILDLYAAALGQLPPLFKHLLVLRSMLVRPLGLSAVSFDALSKPIDTQRAYVVGDKLGRWTLYHKDQDEIITGANDIHLDFRVSMLRDDGQRVVLSTAMMTHNSMGRIYLRAILPFHRYGIASLLTRASRSGRL